MQKEVRNALSTFAFQFKLCRGRLYEKTGKGMFFKHLFAKIHARFLAASALLFLPLTATFVSMIATQNRAIDFASLEIAGASYLSLLQTIHTALLEERSGETNPRLPALLHDMEKARASRKPLPGTDADFTRLSACERASTDVLACDAAINALNRRIGDASNLILDPDLDTYYLMDIVLLRIPAIRSALLLNGANRSHQVRYELNQARLSLEAAMRANEQLRSLDADEAAFRAAFLSLAGAGSGDDEKAETGGAEDARRQSDRDREKKALHLSSEYYRAVIAQLQRLLIERRDRFEREQALSTILILGLVALATVVGFSVLSSVSRPLRNTAEQLSGSASRLDRDVAIDPRAPEEVRMLQQTIGYLLQSLRLMLVPVRNTSALAEKAAEDFVHRSAAISDVIAEQSSAVEEVSAALEETNATNDRIHERMTQQAAWISGANERFSRALEAETRLQTALEGLAGLSESTRARSDEGMNIVDRSLTGMEELRQAARAIVDITALISDISNRTNMLALNASIEAARAGDFGRGFAVVAEEVTRLAEQTAKNSRDIQQIVERMRQSAETGVKNTGDLSLVFRAIQESVQRMTESTVLIARTMREQTEETGGLRQVVTGIEELTTEVLAAYSEQKTTLSEIGRSVAQISDKSATISHDQEGMHTAAEQISEVAIKLASLSHRFEV